jgi:hypothetical protein
MVRRWITLAWRTQREPSRQEHHTWSWADRSRARRIAGASPKDTIRAIELGAATR